MCLLLVEITKVYIYRKKLVQENEYAKKIKGRERIWMKFMEGEIGEKNWVVDIKSGNILDNKRVEAVESKCNQKNIGERTSLVC